VPQVELSTIQNGIIKGVGNVTNLATWINGLKSDKIIYGAGKGVITAENGEMITWVANDIGRSDDNGVITYRGLTFLTLLTLPLPVAENWLSLTTSRLYS
jgi:hypothetical protein